MEEVGDVLGVRVACAKTRVHRVAKKLRRGVDRFTVLKRIS